MSSVGLLVDPEMRYDAPPPYHPGIVYPELQGLVSEAGPGNSTYDGVRRLFRVLGLDVHRFGTPDWNPLCEIVKPGDRVVIKPNLVLHEMKDTVGSNAVVTHASVIRPLIDYCLLAGGPDADITIGDVPLQSADFERIVGDNGLQELVDYYQNERNANVKLIDLRPMRQDATDDFFFSETIEQQGDPEGYTVVDLGRDSRLDPLCERGAARFTVTDYDAGETREHHVAGKHQYFVSNTVLNADVFINVPKLKTHEKAGLTVNLKNLVGINGKKDWLPHFRKGSVVEGGDEWNKFSFRKSMHSRARALLQGQNRYVWAAARRVWHLMRPNKDADMNAGNAAEFFETGGAWYGNDTVWRMVLDLNDVILHFANGQWRDEVPRKYFFLVDGVVAGERHGPLFPSPKPAGCLMAGFNPLAGDTVAAAVMGFDWEKIPLLREGWARHTRPLCPGVTPREIQVALEDGVVALEDLEIDLGFVPAPGWRGHIENTEPAPAG